MATGRTFGHFGRLLHVDLTNGKSAYREIDTTWARLYLGGAGLGTRLLHEFAPRGADPLSPDNPLVLATAPLVGTALTTAAKFAVVTKSPLTGFVADSLASGRFALALKSLGIDALLVSGRAPALAYLFIDGDRVEVRGAAALAGRAPADTESLVRADVGGRPASVAAIGLAGERCVRFATISTEGRHAGRGGAGAVMGAKNLKAIAVRGNCRTRVARPRRLEALAANLNRRALGPATDKYRHTGTVANLSVLNRLGGLPTRNFRQAVFEDADAVSGETLAETSFASRRGCVACPISCEHRFRSRSTGEQRLEYQALCALGPLCGIGDPDCVIDAAALCDRYGLDAVSTGGTLAWAMEFAERGGLRGDGLGLRFGRGDALLAGIRAIAERSGVGDLLAEGSRRAAAATGEGSACWAMHVKGLEMPGWEPRRSNATALGLAVGVRGGCHNGTLAYDAAAATACAYGPLVAAAEDAAALLDSLIVCAFARGCFDDLYGETGDILSAVTGLDFDARAMRHAGERLHTLAKLFNVREGWQPSDDALPERLLTQRVAGGPGDGARLSRDELREMIHDYYRARQWDEQGYVPTRKLEQLGIAGDLKPAHLTRGAGERGATTSHPVVDRSAVVRT